MPKPFYTVEMVEFLRVGYLSMRLPALTKAFNSKFRTDKSKGQIHAALKKRKIRCGRKGLVKGERFQLFTQEQAAWIREKYCELTRQELAEAFNRSFPESPKTRAQIVSFIKNQKIKSGRDGRYEPGHVPWTAGKAGTGMVKPNSGCFKKGNVPANIKPLGSERVEVQNGYIEVKISEETPWTGSPTRYKHKHVVVWEASHGPIPDGHNLRFKDGDKTNCTLENLELISRIENLHLNQLGYNAAPAELKPTVKALAELRVMMFERMRGA